MAISDYVFGNKQWEINRWLLSLSTLGLAAKLLQVDLSSLSIFGLNLGTENTALIPGFIGLALIYALMSYVVARMELQLAHGTSTPQAIEPAVNKITSSKFLTFLVLALSPIPFVLYTVIPIFLSGFTLYILRHDISVVIGAILHAV